MWAAVTFIKMVCQTNYNSKIYLVLLSYSRVGSIRQPGKMSRALLVVVEIYRELIQMLGDMPSKLVLKTYSDFNTPTGKGKQSINTFTFDALHGIGINACPTNRYILSTSLRPFYQ